MIRIYGASDDLIEVEGDISEEFPYYDEPALLAFSDGTILRVRYDDLGIWRITPLFKGRARSTYIICNPDPFDDSDYSDQVHLFDEELDEPIRWVLHGGQYALPRREGNHNAR